jgi:hypothetical protein
MKRGEARQWLIRRGHRKPLPRCRKQFERRQDAGCAFRIARRYLAQRVTTRDGVGRLWPAAKRAWTRSRATDAIQGDPLQHGVGEDKPALADMGRPERRLVRVVNLSAGHLHQYRQFQIGAVDKI